MRLMKSPLTRLLVVACVLIFLAQTVNPQVTEAIWLTPDSLSTDPARLVTSMFAHGGLLHLGVNMYALWMIGSQLEEKLGPIKYLLVYLASGLLGGSIYLLSNPTVPAVGASGAIFGLLGLALPYTRYSMQVVTVVLINVFIGFTIPNIAWQAHLGGLAAGFFLGWFWFQKPEWDARRKQGRTLKRQ